MEIKVKKENVDIILEHSKNPPITLALYCLYCVEAYGNQTRRVKPGAQKLRKLLQLSEDELNETNAELRRLGLINDLLARGAQKERYFTIC